MERRLVTAIAATAAVIAAVAAAAVETSSTAENGPESSIDAAHQPGTFDHEHAPGTAPLPGPGTRALISENLPLALAGGAPLLRPDVFSLRATDLQLRTGNGRVLRFAARLANGGPGPMVVRPRGQRQCPAGQRHARQLIHVDRNRDGRFQRRTDTAVRSRGAGCMVDHPTHGHWHFDAMASYRLVDPSPRRVVAGRPKVSFCLRDNAPVPGTRPRQRRAYFGECGRNRVQGVSPGWFDLYSVTTPGQSVRLPSRMPNGVYCLVLRADPRDQLLEANESNNANARPVRIRGNRLSTPQTRACRGLVR
jgi:hypothetical protein